MRFTQQLFAPDDDGHLSFHASPLVATGHPASIQTNEGTILWVRCLWQSSLHALLGGGSLLLGPGQFSATAIGEQANLFRADLCSTEPGQDLGSLSIGPRGTSQAGCLG